MTLLRYDVITLLRYHVISLFRYKSFYFTKMRTMVVMNEASDIQNVGW